MEKLENISYVDLTASDDGSEDAARLEMKWDSKTDEILQKSKKWIDGVLVSAKSEKKLYTSIKVACKLLILASSILNILTKYVSDEIYIAVIMNSIVLLANNIPDIFGVDDKLSAAEKQINNCVRCQISIDSELKKHKKDRVICDQYIIKINSDMRELLNLGADSGYL